MLRNVRRVIGGIFVALLALLPDPAMAAPNRSSRADSLERSGLTPRREVAVETIFGDLVRGRFVRFDESEALILRRYDASDDRFLLKSIPSSTLAEVRLVQKKSSARNVLLGTLIGGVCGGTVGYLAGSRSSGDVGPSDSRPIFAAGGFLMGAMVGLFTGAFATSSTNVETVIWTR